MDTSTILKSGLLEIYCMELASAEERQLVETLAPGSAEISSALEDVKARLYPPSPGMSPPPAVKRNIFDHILNKEAQELHLPGLLSPDSSPEAWIGYIRRHKTGEGQKRHIIYVAELPSTQNLYSYVVFAQKGAAITETHGHECERLLMLQGSCTVITEGVLNTYTAGDYIEIPSGTEHVAECTSENTMIAVGQRMVC